MSLQQTGAISLAQVRSELKLSGSISLGSTAVRKLLGKASGAISLKDAYGKSNMLQHTFVSQDKFYNDILFSGYDSSMRVGSLTPNMMEGSNVAITRFGYNNEERGEYYAMELKFASPVPYNFIDVYGPSGGLFTTLKASGNKMFFTYEEELLNEEWHQTFCKTNQEVSFKGR